MSISVKTLKMLWGRAANRCAFPGCCIELVIDSSETDDEALVGDACHIVAESEDGPRGNVPVTREERDKYANLILLCKIHHKVIDDQPNLYTVEKLKEMKRTHEQWVRESLSGFDSAKQRDDERYATLIEEWAELADLDNWRGWTYGLLNAGQPSLLKEKADTLKELNNWILSRVWPHRYCELEASLENFRRVLNDLLDVFHQHAYQRSDYDYWTEKFYRAGYGKPELELRLTREYDFHVDLVQDLTLELTRAANYISDKVRQFIFPAFRLNEGVLLVRRDSGFDCHIYRTEYQTEQRIPYPYPGLEEFKHIRRSRDFYVGHGHNPHDQETVKD